jgi:hypothetical protein
MCTTYSVLFDVRTNAYSSGVKKTGESKVNVVLVVVFARAEFAIVETCTLSGFNETSLNGITLEALGNPLTIGRSCNLIGRTVSFVEKFKVTFLKNSPFGNALGST